MESQPLVINPEQVPDFVATITSQVVAAVRDNLAAGRLPEYYKFPEDIIAMTGEHIPVGTIRRWKTDGYLRTIKIGSRTFVTKDAWKWFLANHAELMAAAPNNRGSRLKGAGDNK